MAKYANINLVCLHKYRVNIQLINAKTQPYFFFTFFLIHFGKFVKVVKVEDEGKVVAKIIKSVKLFDIKNCF